jgi:hypothetical protein
MSSTPHALRDALRSRKPQLLTETEALIGNVTPLLWHTLSTFPSGTSHTPQHTTTVEHIAGMLLSPALLRQLTDDEIQLLILACHFHDLGMAGTESDNTTHEMRDQVRRDHAIRIGDVIIDKWAELGFSNKTLAELLSEVCRGHRPTKSDGRATWRDIRSTGIVAPGRAVRLRLLSALIYASDELHIGSDRASPREEDWLHIENEESRRHWKRHQQINGPAVINNTICFEARPTTMFTENDLRSHVFRKAFSAVRDANTQMADDGIVGEFPKLSVQWIRNEIWKLILLQVQSDHRGRSIDSIASQIKQHFEAGSAKFDWIGDLCVEQGISDEQVMAEIKRELRDFQVRRQLVPSPVADETLLLNTEARAANCFLDLARQADDQDVLFGGRYASHYEFDLLRSDYGKAFAEQSLVPHVETGFGVNLATEQTESPVLNVLRASPTAVKMLTEFTPAPSVLVKRHLLRLVVLAGASLDLLRSPNLLLEERFRHGVQDLSREVAANQPQFLRFIEELALIGGYSYAQVHDAMLNTGLSSEESEATEVASSNAPAKSTFKVRISQSIPPNLPATAVSFPYLMLAGSRAGVTVEMLNTAEAPLKVNVEDDADQQFPKLPPARIAIGPGAPSLPGRLDVRATFEFDPESHTGELLLRFPDEKDRDGLPLIVGLPVAAMKAGAETARTQIGFYWPAVTAQLLIALERMLEQCSAGTVEWRMISTKDRRIIATQRFAREEAERFVPHPFKKELLHFLYSRSPESPLPFWISDDEVSVMEADSTDDRQLIYEKYAQMSVAEKTKVTSITLKCTTVDGRDLREEYLGEFPHVTFNPPQIDESSKLTQQELNDRWENPTEQIMLSASFTSDYYELAKEIREWARDPSKPFPLNVSSGPPPSPVFKTRFELVNCPHIDRLWYVERPILLRVRPIQRREQWEVEASYWESVDDHERARLLRERIDADRASKRSEQLDSETPDKEPG